MAKDEKIDLMGMMSEAAGEGFDNVKADDLSIPFLTIVQAACKYVKKSSPDLVPEAKIGQVINSATKALYDTEKEPITVIPVGFNQAWVEYIPKTGDNKGGFVASYPDNSPELAQVLASSTPHPTRKMMKRLPNGHDLVETNYHSVILLADDSAMKAVISMSSSSMRVSKEWLTFMTTQKGVRKDKTKFNLPMFAYTYKLSTFLETKNDNEYFNWKWEKGDMVSELELFNECRETSKALVDNPPLLGAPEEPAGYIEGGDAVEVSDKDSIPV